MASLSSSRPPPPPPAGGPPAPPPPAEPPGGVPDIWRAYLEHLCFVMALARSLGVRRKVDREDVAHEVFAIAWEQQDRYDPAKGTVRAWLASIAIHEAKNWRRLARNRLDHGADPDEQRSPAHTAEHHTADAEVRALARGLAEELPEELRLPLELIDFHDLTHEEAAAALRVPQSTLSSRYYKARSEYKKKIDRLRAKKQLSIDDVRGVAIPIPPPWRRCSTRSALPI
jgi:RNA polymerase sigma factor (sigma-70 family)